MTEHELKTWLNGLKKNSPVAIVCGDLGSVHEIAFVDAADEKSVWCSGRRFRRRDGAMLERTARLSADPMGGGNAMRLTAVTMDLQAEYRVIRAREWLKHSARKSVDLASGVDVLVAAQALGWDGPGDSAY